MNLQDIYKAVQIRLKSVEFEKLWPAFKAYNFALYNQENVVLKDKVIPMNDQFVGNTVIKYDGFVISQYFLMTEEKGVLYGILSLTMTVI
ncbi:hypothetical protein KHQ88_06075 [Mycoplasmatota bacterium]|nr:hypothetical protein KHQ88_06075 [Mycoplasmatota bacterium]